MRVGARGLARPAVARRLPATAATRRPNGEPGSPCSSASAAGAQVQEEELCDDVEIERLDHITLALSPLWLAGVVRCWHRLARDGRGTCAECCARGGLLLPFCVFLPAWAICGGSYPRRRGALSPLWPWQWEQRQRRRCPPSTAGVFIHCARVRWSRAPVRSPRTGLEASRRMAAMPAQSQPARSTTGTKARILLSGQRPLPPRRCRSAQRQRVSWGGYCQVAS